MLGLPHQRPCDLQALALATGEVAAVLLDPAVDATGAARDDLVQRRVLQRRDHGLVGDGRIPQGHVVADRPLEEEHVLVDEGDGGGERAARDVLQPLPVDADRALPRGVQARYEPGDRGLAAARAADQGHLLARADRQGEAGEQGFVERAVAERDVLQLDMTLE